MTLPLEEDRQEPARALGIDPARGWPRAILLLVLGAPLALLAIYVAGWGVFDDVLVRGGFVALAVLVMVALIPLNKQLKVDSGPAYWACLAVDLVVASFMILAAWRMFAIRDLMQIGLYDYTFTDNVFATMGILAILEMARRAFGWAFFTVVVVFIAYAYIGPYLPGLLAHPGYSTAQIIRTVWWGFDGVFGRPVAVVSSTILIFIVFGALLEGVGAGRVLLKLATVMTGRTRGGPAHAAVVGSAAFGTMSGSVVANVVGTGVFTIPMIIGRGFKRAFAGAVEATASTGGQIMPPVMGAVAFIMADVTGIPYLVIAVAALVPALFFYAALFCAIAVEASRLGIERTPARLLPRVSLVEWLQSTYLLVPLTVIVLILASGRSPAMAGLWAVISALALATVFSGDLRRRPDRLVGIIGKAGEACAQIMVAVAAVGIIIGIVNMTGVGQNFAQAISHLARDSMFAALVLMMIASLILGMGLPTVPAYLIIVIFIGPALSAFGVELLLVHLFVLYFGVLSTITPPVALGAFAAAPIAGSSPMHTAAVSVRVALIGFIIPFVMVYNPSLVLVNEGFDLVEFIWVVIRLGLAIWLLTTALSGFAGLKLTGPERLLRALAAVALLWPILIVEIAALVVGLVVIGARTRAGMSVWARSGRDGRAAP
jgi:TRAP transporter 4TM/12TM fusion protein